MDVNIRGIIILMCCVFINCFIIITFVYGGYIRNWGMVCVSIAFMAGLIGLGSLYES
jgi:hypothetical protein